MKEYRVIIATGAKHVEDALNEGAAEGFEFCGFVPSPGGKPLIIMEREADTLTFIGLEVTYPPATATAGGSTAMLEPVLIAAGCTPDTCQAARELKRLEEYLAVPDGENVIDYAINEIEDSRA